MQVLREFYDGAKGEEEKLNELYREMVSGRGPAAPNCKLVLCPAL